MRLEYNDEIIQIDNLTDFIEKQSVIKNEETEKIVDEIKMEKDELDKLRKEIDILTENYRIQEKQIVMFLNCKQSFFKKLKYYFKKPVKGTRFNVPKTEVQNKEEIDNTKETSGKMQSNEKEKTEEIQSSNKEKTEETKSNETVQNAYNLSDLIKLCKSNKKEDDELKNIKSDIFAMKNKKSTLEKRVKNAKMYIDEIERHKKSIFEFWKFAKKDEDPALKEGEEVVEEKKLDVAFDLDEDMPEFAEKVDILQRQKLSIDECNSIFACKYVLNSINAIFTGNNEQEALEQDLKNLQSKYVSNKQTEIFGDIEEDYTKVRNLNNKKHRENKKNIYSILRVNDKTTIEEFRNSIENVVKLLNEAYKKITAIANFSVYYTDNKENEYTIAEINPKNVNVNDLEEKVVYKMQIKRDDNILYFSNITYYDNYNETLPSGMDEGTEVLIKLKDKKNKKETIINLIEESDLYNIKIDKIKVVEWYD